MLGLENIHYLRETDKNLRYWLNHSAYGVCDGSVQGHSNVTRSVHFVYLGNAWLTDRKSIQGTFD